MMQAVQAIKPGSHDDPAAGTELVELPIPEPKQGEILIKVLLRVVNPVELYTLMGHYGPALPIENWPIIPGIDGMGVVHKLGPGVQRFTEGQRVAVAGTYKHGNGTWAEYAAFPETDLVAVPNTVSNEDAAQFFVNPLTTYCLLEVLNIPKGGYIVFTAAGSALARMGIHLAKHAGLKTIGIVRRDEQRQELLKHGCYAVISSASEDVVARIKEITGGEGADGALDSVAGKTLRQLTSSVKPGGTVVVYGAMGGLTGEVDIWALLSKDVTVKGFSLDVYLSHRSAEEKATIVQSVMDLFESKVIQPSGFVGQMLPLSEFATAVAESSKDARGGKVFMYSS